MKIEWISLPFYLGPSLSSAFMCSTGRPIRAGPGPRQPLRRLVPTSLGNSQEEENEEHVEDEMLTLLDYMDNIYDVDDDSNEDLSPDWNSTNFTTSKISLDHISETFEANVSYFYLQDELKLSEKALWGVVFDANSALGMRPDVLRRKVQVMQDPGGLSIDDIRLLLERKPTTLHLGADGNISPTILFLQRSLDLSKSELRNLVVGCPAVLSYSLRNIQMKFLFFTQIMQFSLTELRALVTKEPKILRASVKSGLIPHFKFWSEDLQFSIEDLRTLVLANPFLLMYSLEKNLVPKCIYLLLMKLEATAQEIQQLLLRYPKFCDMNLDRVLWPTIAYFLNDLEIPTHTVRHMLVRFPRLVSHSLDRKIKPMMGYLRYELDLAPDVVEDIVSRSPSLLGLRLDLVREKSEYLKVTLLNNSTDHLRKVIAAMPSLLTVNVESNLKPKVDFLEGAGVNVTEALLKQPATLAYSLELRLQPRVAALQRAGADVNSMLWKVLPLTDLKFAERMASIEKAQRKTMSQPVDASGRITHWVR